MFIVYRDILGCVAVEVDTRYSILFVDGVVYFDDTNGKTYRVPVSSLVEIAHKNAGDPEEVKA